jgi:hypothetical protein
VRVLLRTGLLLLAATEFVVGVWTSLFPESFYNDVPTVDLTPPFSEHLFRDFGTATLGLAVILGAAAIWLETRLVIVALVAYLAFSAPHFAFHLQHLEGTTPVQATVLTGLLAASVVAPILLIYLTVALRRRVRLAAPPEQAG